MYVVFVSLCILASMIEVKALNVIPGPTSLKVTKVNLTTAVARWDPIPKEYVPGVFYGYSVGVGSLNYWQSFPTTNTSAILKELKDWKHYTISVFGYTRYIKGFLSTLTFSTPTIPNPVSLNMTRIGKSVLKIYWSPIPNNQASGVILGYKVQLRDINNKAIQVNTTIQTSIVIDGLQLNTGYYIYVQGYTAAEIGQSSVLNIYFYNVPPITNLYVNVINKTTTVASWDPIPKEHVQGILLGYNVGLYVNPPRKYLFGNRTNKNKIVFGNLKDWLTYTVSVNAYTFNKSSPRISKQFHTAQMRNPSSRGVIKINSTTVLIQWRPIPKENVNGVLIGYRVTITNSSDVILKQWNTKETSVLINSNSNNMRYYVFIQGYTATERGRSTFYSFSLRDYIIPIPEVNGLSVTTINSTTVAVNWKPIPKEYVLGDLQMGYKILLYRIFYYGGILNQPGHEMTSTKPSLLLRNLLPGVAYRIFVWGYTNSSNGYRRELIFSTPCGGISRNKKQGYIHFKRYEYVTSHVPDCSWRIEEQRSKIMINIDVLHIKPDLNCSNAFLQVTNGQGKRLGKYCGSTSSLKLEPLGSANIDLRHLTRNYWGYFEIKLSYKTSKQFPASRASYGCDYSSGPFLN